MEANKEQVKEQAKKINKTTGFIIEFIIYIVMIFCCIYVVPKYVLQRTVVSGESMENTLHTGESLLVEKISKRFVDPKRYDIIVLHPKGEAEDEFYVKRVIGLPGETIQIKENDIYINGKKIEDGYGKTKMVKGDEGIAEKPIKLAEDEFFVLGDNREVSLDSRDEDLGPIRRQDVVGKSILRIWPLDKFGVPK